MISGRPPSTTSSWPSAVERAPCTAPRPSRFPDFEKAMLGCRDVPLTERADSGEDAIAYADFAAGIQHGLEQAMSRLSEVARPAASLRARRNLSR